MKSISSISANLEKRLAPFLVAGLLASGLVTPAHAGEDNTDASDEYLDRIELRSVVSLPDELLFSLHDPEENKTFWIEIGETHNDIEAVSFDEEKTRLTLRHNEAVRELGLNNSRVEGSGGEEEEAAENSGETSPPRETWRQRREDWHKLRERWKAASEGNPEMQKVSNHFIELRGEWRNLRLQMRNTEQGTEEFEALRERRNELREEQRVLNRYARETIANNPAFDEEDLERANRLLQGASGPRRRRSPEGEGD